MNKAAYKKLGKPSLKWELIGIVLACWILPVLIIVGVLGYYINNNINRQIINTISTSVDNAVKTSKSRIEAAVVASRNASYYPTVKAAYYAFQNTGDYVALYGKVSSFLSQQYKYDDKFLTTMLYYVDEPGRIYYTFNDRDSGSYSGVRRYQENVHEAVQQISQTLGTKVEFLNVNGNIYMVRNILDYNRLFEPYAVIVMELNPEVMFDGIKNVVWETGATIWLNNTSLVLGGEPFNKDVKKFAFENGKSTFQDYQDLSVVSGMEDMQSCRLSYAVGVDRLSLMQELSGFKSMFIGMLVLIIPLLGLAIWFFYRTISCPIDSLISAASRIEGGDLGYQINSDLHNQEFQYLTDAFNSMSARLKYQFERIYSEELALRDAKIMALQSQINPHFLNNTLEIINWEARLADNIKVSRMIEALSTMLDAAMDRKGKPVVRLSEEMMYADAYLYIISERLGKRLTVKKEIDETLLNQNVPRLILQPIIENAVEHGVQTQQKGNIVIRVYSEEDKLILEVNNDGAMTEEDERHIARLLSPDYDAKDESSSNLGICNVNLRLKMIYGENSGLTIKMDNNGHVVAKIIIDSAQLEQ
ncbi:sensor histidine kinase [Hydrogenoanaerobacterium sp.]|uniref:sensor histidine kinase n=1 Tax=Hydrogenoanaerobacterium sp. TaxID=2953763 RepID=UPI002899BDD5|nr:sensor histidine kinase [Hydrogenoanaerobacterium sp.]